jgi:hypothetical protein
MSEITIYDTESGKFYEQTVTGATIPQPRLQLCAVGAGTTGNYSYEMCVLLLLLECWLSLCVTH